MDTLPDNANEHCPGTQSATAGQVSACQGCPNQQICSSGVARLPDPGIELVRVRLAAVNHKVLVMSGKGGVGKSTFTALLARALAAADPDKNIAVCDIDVCGPSMPRLLGVQHEQVHQSGSGWSPVYVEDNLSLMSIAFLLESADSAVIWRGPKKNALIKQFLSEVDWGQVDVLLVDTPPGTSDEHLAAQSYLGQAGLSGAVILSTPQETALLDVRKQVDFCRKVHIPVLGVVENMAQFHCTHCKVTSGLFPANTGGAAAMCSSLGLPLLGSLPLDPLLTRACDEGLNPFTVPGPAALAFTHIASKLMDILQSKQS